MNNNNNNVLPPFICMGVGQIHSWAAAHPTLVNQQDEQGQTLLNVAAGGPLKYRYPCHADAVRRLIVEKGCDVNGRDRQGRNPTFQAGNPEVTDVLLELGADPTMPETGQGITPLI